MRLRLNQASALAGLPWEYLWDPAQDQFLALLPGLSIMRHPEVALAPPPLEDKPPIRGLVLIANPLGSCPLDLQQEWESIERALRPLCSQGLLILERIERATLASLGETLQDKEIHIIHFLGHGSAELQDGEGYLWFEDAEGFAEKVGTQAAAATASIPATAAPGEGSGQPPRDPRRILDFDWCTSPEYFSRAESWNLMGELSGSWFLDNLVRSPYL